MQQRYVEKVDQVNERARTSQQIAKKKLNLLFSSATLGRLAPSLMAVYMHQVLKDEGRKSASRHGQRCYKSADSYSSQ